MLTLFGFMTVIRNNKGNKAIVGYYKKERHIFTHVSIALQIRNMGGGGVINFFISGVLLSYIQGHFNFRNCCNHFISNKGEWNNCFSKFSNRVLPPIFIAAIIEG